MDQTFKLLIKDHKKVKEIIEELMNTTPNATKKRKELLQQLKTELKEHENIEETLVYPVLKEKSSTKDLTLEAFQEHHLVDLLLEEIESTDFKDEAWKAKLTVLQENLEHHIKEEEKELFPKALETLSAGKLEEISKGISEMKGE